MQKAKSTVVQEVAFILANRCAYVLVTLDAGLEVEPFAKHLSPHGIA